MTRLLAALTMTTMLAMPAFAADMPCSDFMAMDSAGQMAAMEDAMAADGAMADDAMAADGAMADDAMASDDAMGAEGDMATDDAMAADGMAAEGGMEAMVAACTAHPDMTVMEAMGAMQ